MKKLLLTSTALATMVAGSVFAGEALQVGVGGFLDFQFATNDAKQAYTQNLTANQKDVAFNSRARAHVKAMSKADNGLVYGGVIGLATNTSKYIMQNDNQLDKTYLFLESSVGRFELGTNYSASRAMKVEAASIARATGGASQGDYVYYVNTTPSAASVGAPASYNAAFDNSYWVSSDIFSDYNVSVSGLTEEVRKVTYYSPQISGFQFGLSYMPDTTNVGDNNVSRSFTNMVNDRRDYKNVLNAGVTFTQQYDQLALALSAVGETGRSNASQSWNGATLVSEGYDYAGTKHQLESYAFGGSLSYANFALAGSFGNVNKKSVVFDIATPTVHKKGVNYWTAGASYVQGPVGASLTFFDSKYMRNHLKTTSVGLDYQLAPGMLPYVEANMFEFKSGNYRAQLPKNRGHVVLVGTQLKF